MSQEAPAGALSSAFPPPPTYYTHFTSENLAALKALRFEDGTLPPTDELPEELQCLVPPPPPAGSYRAFGEEWTVPERHPSLEDAGIRQLYPPTSTAAAGSTNPLSDGGDGGKELTFDRTIELKRLSKSLLLNYLELVGVMGMTPELFHEKTSDLETILFNMHHLINEYRPHQARETLCSLMEEQLERTRRETEENREAVRRVESILAGLGEVLKKDDALSADGGGGGGHDVSDDVRTKKDDEYQKAKAKDMGFWNALTGLGA